MISIFKTEADPEIYLANDAKENGPADLEAVTEYVREGVLSGKSAVIIKADRDLPSGFVEDVARAANEAEAEQELTFYVGITDRPQR